LGGFACAQSLSPTTLTPGMSTSTDWHFFVMILASLAAFLIMMRIVLNGAEFALKKATIFLLALLIVVIGMLLGKYGALAGLPWWIYYPVPMLMTVLLPPFTLKFDRRQTLRYLSLSFLSAPLIHACFSFLLGWKEYMPFWNIPSIAALTR
jgi:hypothetical protein